MPRSFDPLRLLLWCSWQEERTTARRDRVSEGRESRSTREQLGGEPLVLVRKVSLWKLPPCPAGLGCGRERLSRFLRFVVERHLEGRDHELKESVIAIEIFGRL
jgi:hypothetical protein